MKFYILLVGCFITIPMSGLNGESVEQETWNPREHPAIIDRQITGYTSPSRHMLITAEFGGIVRSVQVKEGEVISGVKGSRIPVVILDNTFAGNQKDRANTGVELASLKIKQIESQIALIQRQLEFHDNEVKRIELLAKSGKVNQRDLDKTQFEADSAAIQVQAEKTALGIAKSELNDAQILLKDATERFNRHTVYSPSGWVVQKRFAEPGSFVQNGEILLRLADVDELAINLRLSEQEILALKKDEPISIHFVQQKVPPVPARIHRIDVDYDSVTNKRLVELRIDGDLAPSPAGGLQVSIKIQVPDPNGLVLVPKDFLLTRLEQSFVTLEDGSELPVIPLRQQERWILISGRELPDSALLVHP